MRQDDNNNILSLRWRGDGDQQKGLTGAFNVDSFWMFVVRVSLSASRQQIIDTTFLPNSISSFSILGCLISNLLLNLFQSF